MDFKNFFENYSQEISRLLASVDTNLINQSVDLIKKKRDLGNTVYIIGNGGSSSIASHVSVDFTKNAKIRSVNFNEADLITCFSNDYGYERWIEKSFRKYGCS